MSLRPAGSRLRILLLNQYYAPAEAATAQLLTDLAGELVGAGHQVTVLTAARSYPDPFPIRPRREEIDGVRVERAWTTGFGRGARLGRLMDYATYFAGVAWRLARGARADVVVSLTTPPLIASLAAALARRRGWRTLYWVMDVYPELAFELGVVRERSPFAGVLKRVARYGLTRSDSVVALGEAMADRLEELGAPRSRLDVAHNWADGEAIRPAPTEGHSLREQLGWSGRFVVLYSGNLGMAHEFETILDAAERLADTADVLFAFVGSGPRREAVEREVRARGLGNVEFREHVPRERLGESLTSGDVHLISLRNGLAGLLVPSKIYGVMAAGRPAIFVGPDECEVARIVSEANCGCRVAPGDGAGLAAALLRLRAEPAEREESGRRGRQAFEERFSRAAGVARLRDLIERAAS